MLRVLASHLRMPGDARRGDASDALPVDRQAGYPDLLAEVLHHLLHVLVDGAGGGAAPGAAVAAVVEEEHVTAHRGVERHPSSRSAVSLPSSFAIVVVHVVNIIASRMYCMTGEKVERKC